MSCVRRITLGSLMLPLSTYHSTIIHICGTHAYDSVGFRCSGAPASSETPTRCPEVNHVVYPFHGPRKWADQWNFFFGCIRVVHRNIQNQVLAHVVGRFPPVYRKREFSALSAQHLCGVSVVCEAGHTWEFDVASFNLPPHYYTDM